jgi:lactoylglutathione lyase
MITRPILAGSTRATRVRWSRRGIDSLRVAFLHTCYRITDIDRSVAFYSALGFEEIRRAPIRDEAINVFMNQPGDGDEPRLELTYNFGVSSYELGTAYGHIAIGASDLDATLARLAELGIDPERPPYAIREGSSRICFVRDPDGYRVEIVERPAKTVTVE